MSIANIYALTHTKNAVEIRAELNASGTKVEYICIGGVKCGILGSVNKKDREAAIKALNAAYIASNGNVSEMIQKLATIATIEEKEIEPDEVVNVNGVEVMLSYDKKTAYTMDGEEIANCTDLPDMPKEAVKAVLVARATVELN